MQIGFIGCGNISHFHADVLMKLNQNIVAVAAKKNSPNIIPFSDKYFIKKKYYNWHEMVDNENLDALWVVASWNQIDSLLIPLIETGLPLFLEKPVALSSGKILKAIEIHKKSGQYIQVGYNRRFYSFIDKIKLILEKGELRSIWVEIPESIEFSNVEIANNLWLINSSHVIDLLMYLVGPLNIKYKKTNILTGNDIPSSFNAILETEQNVPIHLSAEWNAANNFGITFFVDNKRIVLKPLEMVTIYEGFDIIEPTGPLPIRQYKPKIVKKYFCNGKFKPGLYEQAEYFFKQLNSNNFNNKHSDLQTCLLTTKLIENLTEINYA
jgi:predicted dehydrogenase